MVHRTETTWHAGETAEGAPNLRPERRHVALRGKKKVLAYCTPRLYNNYVHDTLSFLSDGEEQLITFNTGKRDRNGEPILGPMVADTCFHVWHAGGRGKGVGRDAELKTLLLFKNIYTGSVRFQINGYLFHIFRVFRGHYFFL